MIPLARKEHKSKKVRENILWTNVSEQISVSISRLYLRPYKNKSWPPQEKIDSEDDQIVTWRLNAGILELVEEVVAM
jgi:hypothetical protein